MGRFVLAVLGLIGVLALLQFLRTPPATPVQQSARRVISLAPNLTGLLFELGCGHQLVGITTYCDYPPEVARIERIGDFLNPNLERVVSLHPDLIVAEQWSSSRTVPRLKQLGFRVVDFPTPRSLVEIYRLIEAVGRLMDTETAATELVNDMKARVKRIEARASRLSSRPGLYLEIDLPTWTVGKASFTNEAIATCGARNIFEDLPSAAPQVSKEAIIARNPDIIVTFSSTAEEVSRRAGWGQISAVRNGRIIEDFDEDLLSRGNHRIVTGMELLQSRIFEVMGLDD